MKTTKTFGQRRNPFALADAVAHKHATAQDDPCDHVTAAWVASPLSAHAARHNHASRV